MRRVSHRPLLQRISQLRANVTPYDAAYIALEERCTIELLSGE